MNTDVDPGTGGPTRRRNAAVTRQALLTAARTLMTEHGVEGTSTRDVAAAAGVNQALVYRYFGTKEKLFSEAANGSSTTFTDDLMASTSLLKLPRVLLDRTLEVNASTEQHGDGMAALIGGANDSTIRAILRQRIDTSFGQQLAPRLDGPDALLRVELLAALLTGIVVLREKVGTPALKGADLDVLGAYVERLAAALLAYGPAQPD